MGAFSAFPQPASTLSDIVVEGCNRASCSRSCTGSPYPPLSIHCQSRRFASIASAISVSPPPPSKSSHMLKQCLLVQSSAFSNSWIIFALLSQKLDRTR